MTVFRSVYESPDSLKIVLEVPEPPMGTVSGYIPPPQIIFYKNGSTITFVYQGDEKK